jgi:Zn-dependent protease
MIDLLFSDPARFFQQLVLVVPALLIGVTVHELAHGVVADRLGDPTARAHGRLTLNPLPHIDPLGAVAILLTGFGWAKPVPVNAYNLRRPVRDMAWVAAAGPASNLLAGFLAALAWQMLAGAGAPAVVALPLQGLLGATYAVNVSLAVFNLIPLPPLDGGHFLPYFLPRRTWSALHTLEQYGPFILLILLMSGATRVVLEPARQVVALVFGSVLQLML